MKTCLRLLPTQSRWLLSFCLGAWLGFQFLPADARLKVTTSVSANVKTPRSLNNGIGGCYLCCDGYKTYITRDADGKTQVYVNDEGGDFSTDEKYRVEIEETGLDWSSYTIYAGKSGRGERCNNAYIKMDGGFIGGICLSGYGGASSGTNRNEVQYSYLEVTGGTVGTITASNGTGNITHVADIVLSGMKYLGNALASYTQSSVSEAYLFVAPDCEFTQPFARMTPTRLEAKWSIIMPDSATWTKLVAMGNFPTLPSGYDITCPVFEDHSLITPDIMGTLHITRCDGWQSNKSIDDYNVTMPNHKRNCFLISPATCTSNAIYRSTCSVCGINMAPSFPTSALGHDVVTEPDIPATCWHPGRTGRQHCGRCGLVLSSGTEIPMTDHVFSQIEVPQSILNSSNCFIPASDGTASFNRCKVCSYLIMVKGTMNEHNWVNITSPEDVPSQSSALVKKYTIAPTCSLEGLAPVQYCSSCSQVRTAPIEPLDHDFEVHERVEPTCTEGGHVAYKTCSTCEKHFLPNADPTSTQNVLLDQLDLQALGHQYGILPPSNQPAAFIHASNCTEPALYWDVCAQCGELSAVHQVEGSPALGHKYRIRQIDFVSPQSGTDGEMSLECEHCAKSVTDLPFSLSASFGTSSLQYKDGFWCKSKLIETTQIPTCIEGEGIYEATVCYKGQRLSAHYRNFIPACGYLHNYDADGICRETHYQYDYDSSTGQIRKDQYGNIQYRSANSGSEPFVDETVYSSCGYVAVPFESPRIRPRTSISGPKPVLDPEDGSVMTYTEYRVTQFEEPVDLLSVPQSQVEPFYLGTFGELWFNDFSDLLDNPLLLGIDTHEGETVYSMNDAAPYRANTAFPLTILEYIRTFSNTHWQPLYVPFPMPVAELESRHLQVARLNDTHMYDDDFNGTIDRVTLEFIRVTSGELLPSRPYLVRATQTNLPSYYYFENTVMQPARETSVECSTVDQKITITGTYEGLPAGVLYDNNYYAMNSQGNLQRAATASATLKPQRWYLKIENKDGTPLRESDYFAAEVRVLGASDDEEETSGIDDHSPQPTSTAPALYRLDGTRLSTSSPVGPGIYVSDGKRIVVR